MLDGDAYLDRPAFVDLLLSFTSGMISRLSIAVMSYQPDSPSSCAVHNRLVSLAREGVEVELRVDNTYARRIEAGIDVPTVIARRTKFRERVLARELAFAELRDHGARVIFSGGDRPPIFPFSRLDHRKLLYAAGPHMRPMAAVFGLNLNFLLDEDVADFAFVTTEPRATDWIRLLLESPHVSQPTTCDLGAYELISRELCPEGNAEADDAIRKLIDDSRERLMFFGQWLPDGDVLRRMAKAALRGVRVEVYSNVPRLAQRSPYSPFRIALARRIVMRTPGVELYVPRSDTRFFHIKALVADPDQPFGSVLTGTDNMTNELVRKWRTREVLVRLRGEHERSQFLEFSAREVIAGARKLEAEEVTLTSLVRASAKRGSSRNIGS
jgi:hypothetical protein